jgi:hypothetical protein
MLNERRRQMENLLCAENEYGVMNLNSICSLRPTAVADQLNL